jgi:hypothetical protein
VFEAVTVAGYIDRKSKKQESGQMRIILHAGANKTDEDHLLFSLRRNLNLHHQNKIALPIPKNYRRPLRQRMMQSNHTAPDADARDILLDMFLNGEPEECRTLYMGIPGFFWCPKRNYSEQCILPARDQQFGTFCGTVPRESNASVPCIAQSCDVHSRYDGRG